MFPIRYRAARGNASSPASWFSKVANGLRTGIESCLHSGDIAFDNDGDVGRTDFFFPDDFDIGGFEHCVSRVEDGGKALGFEDSDGLWFHGGEVVFVVSGKEVFTSSVKRVDRVETG